ncbi:hypothetical protein AAMO2058_000722400 [Amorphochlora amoebiformis]
MGDCSSICRTSSNKEKKKRSKRRANELTDAEFQIINDMFDYVDGDDSGLIDMKEIETKLGALNMEKFGSNQSTKVTGMDELISHFREKLYDKWIKASFPQEMSLNAYKGGLEESNLFVNFDTWKKLFLNLKRLKGPRRFMKFIRMLFPELTPQEQEAAENMFRRVDVDGSGKWQVFEIKMAHEFDTTGRISLPDLISILNLEGEISYAEFIYSCRKYKQTGGDLLSLLPNYKEIIFNSDEIVDEAVDWKSKEDKEVKKMLTKLTDAEKIRISFSFSLVDVECKGCITVEDIRLVLGKENNGENKEAIQSLIEHLKNKIYFMKYLDLGNWLEAFASIKCKGMMSSKRFNDFLDLLYLPLSTQEREMAQQVFIRIMQYKSLLTKSVQGKGRELTFIISQLKCLMQQLAIDHKVQKHEFFRACRTCKFEGENLNSILSNALPRSSNPSTHKRVVGSRRCSPGSRRRMLSAGRRVKFERSTTGSQRLPEA